LNNKVIVITAPSGSGKSTIAKQVMLAIPTLAFSISATTRQPRAGEQHGVHYYFMNLTNFESYIKENKFAEYEQVYPGKYYGTLHTELNRMWQIGNTPLLDIDVKGAINIKNYYKQNACTIFIDVPILELKNRLVARGTETMEAITERVNKASIEQQDKNKFDYCIPNIDLEIAVTEVIKTINNFLNK
jgi:guanylate kinase